MLTNLEKKLKFIELVDKMKEIKRIIYIRNWQRESDAEHSWHLAMMVMTFIEDFPELNYEKCLKIALIHDLVEVYAWDTACFDTKMEATKHQREMQAFEKLKNEYEKELPEIISLIEWYEKKDSLESKFVYSLDKVQPIIQSYLEWWKARHEFKIDIEDLKQRQYWKISPEFEILKQILDIYFEKAFRENLIYRKL